MNSGPTTRCGCSETLTNGQFDHEQREAFNYHHNEVGYQERAWDWNKIVSQLMLLLCSNFFKDGVSAYSEVWDTSAFVATFSNWLSREALVGSYLSSCYFFLFKLILTCNSWPITFWITVENVLRICSCNIIKAWRLLYLYEIYWIWNIMNDSC